MSKNLEGEKEREMERRREEREGEREFDYFIYCVKMFMFGGNNYLKVDTIVIIIPGLHFFLITISNYLTKIRLNFGISSLRIVATMAS